MAAKNGKVSFCEFDTIFLIKSPHNKRKKENEMQLLRTFSASVIQGKKKMLAKGILLLVLINSTAAVGL